LLGNHSPKKTKVPRSKIIRPFPATVERAAIKFSLWVKQSVSYSLASRYVRYSLIADLQRRPSTLYQKRTFRTSSFRPERSACLKIKVKDRSYGGNLFYTKCSIRSAGYTLNGALNASFPFQR